jgi:hypothetical protein
MPRIASSRVIAAPITPSPTTTTSYDRPMTVDATTFAGSRKPRVSGVFVDPPSPSDY